MKLRRNAKKVEKMVPMAKTGKVNLKFQSASKRTKLADTPEWQLPWTPLLPSTMSLTRLSEQSFLCGVQLAGKVHLWLAVADISFLTYFFNVFLDSLP